MKFRENSSTNTTFKTKHNKRKGEKNVKMHSFLFNTLEFKSQASYCPGGIVDTIFK